MSSYSLPVVNLHLKEIRSLVNLMKKSGVSVLKMECEGFRITLRIASVITHHSVVTSLPVSPSPSSPTATTASYPSVSSSKALQTVSSPMVGTFYTAPSPEATPFVQLGTAVTPDTVVCIVEAMKVMNEIKAEVSGTIVEILAENGTSVQFGQPLFRVR